MGISTPSEGYHIALKVQVQKSQCVIWMDPDYWLLNLGTFEKKDAKAHRSVPQGQLGTPPAYQEGFPFHNHIIKSNQLEAHDSKNLHTVCT